VSDLSNAKSTAAIHSTLRQRVGVRELTHKARLPFSCFPPRKPACQLQTLAWDQPSVNTVWQLNIGPLLVCLCIWALQQKTIPSTDLTTLWNSSICAWYEQEITCIDLLSQLVRNYDLAMELCLAVCTTTIKGIVHFEINFW